MPARPQTFRTHAAVSGADAVRDYDRRRGSARDRLYDSAWDAASRGHLSREPLCRGCRARGLVRAATVTDHVVPHRGDAAKFWDRTLWQSACAGCHSGVKQQLEAMYRAGRIGVGDLWLDSAVAIRVALRRG